MKRFFECLIPVTICNLKCDYCYVIQRNNRLLKLPKFEYSPEHIRKALSKERLGGICYFSICGAGETFVPEETLQIVKALLEEGHFVNVTTNGTFTNRLKEITQWNRNLRERLHLSFSLHYNELIKHNLLNAFFDNVRMIKDAGCSILVQINLYDGYNKYWDEIKEMCIKEIGAAPQVAATRDERYPKYKFYTDGSDLEYISRGKEMESPLWDFTIENFNKKHNHEFCYAGEWSGTLNLCTGVMTGCYGQGIVQNIFKDISKPIKFRAIGKGCLNKFCMNSSHFLSLGCIPSYQTPTYASLRNRDTACWYTPSMKRFLSGKLYEENTKYGILLQKKSNLISYWRRSKYEVKGLIKKIIKK